MADNIAVKDQGGTTRTIRATDNAAVHVYHSVPASTNGVALFAAAAALGDSVSNPTAPLIGACELLWDPAASVWRRAMANHEGTLLTSAARTAETASAVQTNYGCVGVIAVLNITVASGTGGLILRFVATDPTSTNPIVLNVDISPAITTTGRYGFELSPGSSTAAAGGNGFLHQRTAGRLPLTWHARITVGDASSYTYSVGYMLLR